MPVPPTLTLPPAQSQGRWVFFLAAANSSETAEGAFDEGLSQVAAGNLRASHDKAWAELWLQSTVEVVGSERLSRALIGCMFYLLSAFPSIHDTSGTFGGISPGGLSNGGDGQDYWGHVFWDQVPDAAVNHSSWTVIEHLVFLGQDIWMYPGIALFYPELARALLKYRMGTIEGAKYNAQKQGYKVGRPA